MKENPYDRIAEKLESRMERLDTKIGSHFKDMKPFDKEPVSNDELLYIYENMTPEDMNYLLQTHSRDDINQKLYEMEKIKKRRGM